jgi:hypothetical protein
LRYKVWTKGLLKVTYYEEVKGGVESLLEKPKHRRERDEAREPEVWEAFYREGASRLYSAEIEETGARWAY